MCDLYLWQRLAEVCFAVAALLAVGIIVDAQARLPEWDDIAIDFIAAIVADLAEPNVFEG